jgi:hypothetical protein
VQSFAVCHHGSQSKLSTAHQAVFKNRSTIAGSSLFIL